jgi:hypothetical protein
MLVHIHSVSVNKEQCENTDIGLLEVCMRNFVTVYGLDDWALILGRATISRSTLGPTESHLMGIGNSFATIKMTGA